jgi:hypothetical protein
MEKTNRSRASFIIVYGIGWGALTALLITLNRHANHRIESTIGIVIRFAIFMGMGILFGEVLWRQRQSPNRRIPSRKEQIVRAVIFWALMLTLAVILWRMSKR